jgi:hypothetical protein
MKLVYTVLLVLAVVLAAGSIWLLLLGAGGTFLLFLVASVVIAVGAARARARVS